MKLSSTSSRLAAAAVATLTLSGTLAGCGSSGSTASGGSSASGGSGSKTLTVFAAASLQEPFTALGKQFEAAHPGVKVQFNFGGSPDLATAINNGSPADVFASASTKTMQMVQGMEDVKTFAQNTMEIALPAKNPAHIASLADLAKKGVKVALCQADVPCGVVAAQVLANARLKVTPATEEADVKSVLTKVALDEVDAGIVYVSDVHTAPSTVKGVPIPTKVNAVTTYPIGVVKTTKDATLAQQFCALVEGSAGRAAMATAGFAKP